MPLLTLAQAAGHCQPIRGLKSASLTNQRQGPMMSWLRLREGDSCGDCEGRVNQTFHTLTSLTTHKLLASDWLLSHRAGLWLVTSAPSQPRGVGRAGRQWWPVTVTIRADWEISCYSGVRIVLSIVMTMWGAQRQQEQEVAGDIKLQ